MAESYILVFRHRLTATADQSDVVRVESFTAKEVQQLSQQRLIARIWKELDRQQNTNGVRSSENE